MPAVRSPRNATLAAISRPRLADTAPSRYPTATGSRSARAAASLTGGTAILMNGVHESVDVIVPSKSKSARFIIATTKGPLISGAAVSTDRLSRWLQ
jgi:hypothetical protein